MSVYMVLYDANKGGASDIITFQEKTDGETIKLYNIVPTRTGYKFKGWGISRSGKNVYYYPGDSYSADASITLYAVWEVDYSKPKITNVSIERCDSSGVISDEGTYFKVSFSWSTDVNVSSITIKWKVTTDSDDSWSSSNISASGTSGTITKVFGSGSISIENSYNVRIVVTDTNGSIYLTRTIPARAYAIDFLSGGTGVAFGKPAELSDYLDSNFKAKFRKDVAIDSKLYDKFSTEFQNGLCAYTGSGASGINPDTTLEHLILTDVNTPMFANNLYYIKTEFYNSKTTTSNRMQTAFPYNNNNFAYFRYYFNGVWTNWKQLNVGWYSGTIDFTDTPFTGYVSNSSKSVLFTIPIGAPFYSGTSISASGSLVIRGVKGYFDQATYESPLVVGDTGYTFEFNINTSQMKAGLFGYKITRSTAFTNVTNNTPVSICTHPDNPFKISFSQT